MSSLESADVEDVAKKLKEGLEIKDRKHLFKTYHKCFIGSQAVEYMVASGLVSNAEDAILLGNLLLEQKVFEHVTRDHTFKNEYLFYRFLEDSDEPSHGMVAKVDGIAVSWADFISPATSAEPAPDNLQTHQTSLDQPNLASTLNPEDALKEFEKLEVSPLDEYNSQLLDNVHPLTWLNPKPTSRYNLVVIGAGSGGLVSAAGAAGVGAKVALVEANLLGGDCLNVGCIPSKALIKAAKVAQTFRRGGDFGVQVRGEVEVDFGEVMRRLRRLRAEISPHDSAKRFADLGVDVFIGHAAFLDSKSVKVGDQILEFSKAVIATGATAAIPDIQGLSEVPFLTNATVFNLTELPPRVGVIGAGPIGCELAQSFARFGSKVCVLNRSERLMGKEDPDAVAIVRKAMTEEGVTFRLGVKYKGVKLLAPAEPKAGKPFPEIEVILDGPSGIEKFTFDALLIATGRKPNVAKLGLENAGVQFGPRGVTVTDSLQTTQKNIYAVGDVCSDFKFTHVSDFMARMVIRNALFFGKDKFSRLLIPWATYTEPEVAHVGLYESDLQMRKMPYDTYVRKFEDVDRAIVDSEAEGFVKIHTKKGTDQIVGATITGSHAGDLISEITVAMQNNIGLGKLAYAIHPYPTQAEAIRQCGDLYNKTRLTPLVKTIFRKLMAAQR